MNRTATAAAAALLALTLAGCGGTIATTNDEPTPTVTRTVETVTVPAACTQALDLADDTIILLGDYIGDDVLGLIDALADGDTAGVDKFTKRTDTVLEKFDLGEYTALRDACRDAAAQ